jgi:hypothetical protein
VFADEPIGTASYRVIVIGDEVERSRLDRIHTNRCGKAAPSEAAHVRTGTDRREYACVLIAERILQRKIEFYNSPATVSRACLGV